MPAASRARCRQCGETKSLVRVTISGYCAANRVGWSRSIIRRGAEEEFHPAFVFSAVSSLVDPFLDDVAGLVEGVEDGAATVAAYQLLMTPVGEQDVGLSAEVELRPSADPTAVAVADDVF